ncbi:DUF1993 domain-containing protein [Flagellatimonas centrodinii]|uniref:DUF1993 domain-containing protein n=1 Tax=Flagellatimonas centrodinii TaxID=2806210 RepID=UPI001FFA1484|nr:DUF1993 domain-containing protein [Flagellatimonas centrodinii]ULQ47616.1 DUF1993 domain-containing protein [Flagellatimonas centrodinii]
MSTLSLYAAAVPPLSRALQNLKTVLGKAAAHAEAQGWDAAVLLQARLFPDMFPLVRQVQIATDMAKGCGARLTGAEVPSWPDDEIDFAGLQARIDRACELLAGLDPTAFDGAADRAITLKTPRGELAFTGLSYLQGFVLPNVYFHCTTAYNLLRHNGVPLGKRDFLGAS